MAKRLIDPRTNPVPILQAAPWRFRWRQLPVAVLAVAVLVAVLVFPRVGGPALLVIAAGAAIWWWGWNKRRRSGLSRFAASEGWSYADRDDAALERWSPRPLRGGRDEHAESVLTRQRGDRQVVALDYRTTVSAYGKWAEYWYAVVATTPIHAPGLTLMVVPRAPSQRARSFDGAFAVTCPDMGQARAILTDELTAFLLDDGTAFSWMIAGGDLVTWREGRLDPEKLQDQAAFAQRLVDLVQQSQPGSR